MVPALDRRLAVVAVAALAAVAAVACPGGKAGPGPMQIVAGNGTEGFADGTGEAARFRKPIRLAALSPDSVVVADIFNHAIREVSLDGRVRTIVGGPDRKGFRDGPAEEAQISSPHGVAVSPEGVIAVAEAANHTIRLLTPARSADGTTRYTVSTLAGTAGEKGFADGPVAQARFNSPHATLWDRDGSLLVTDIGNARVRRIRGGQVETVAGAEKGTFVYPMDISLAPDGTLLVADAGANLIRTWTKADGVRTLRVVGGLHTPHGVAGGPDGQVYVADMDANDVVAIARDGRVSHVAGTGQKGGGPRQLNRPAAVLVHAGHLWIADLDNHRIAVVPLG
jgi:DNA-binding beta-propeller fold protein YncE